MPDRAPISPTSPLGVCLLHFDADARITWANAEACRAFELPLASLIGLPCGAPELGLHDDRGAPVEPGSCPVRLAIAGRGATVPRRFDRRGAARSSAFLLSTEARRSADGAIVEVVALLAPLPEEPSSGRHALREAARAHADAQRLYRSAFLAMGDGIVVFDRDGAIVDANAAGLRILGLPFERALGLQPTDPFWRLLREDGTPMPREEFPFEVTRRLGQPLQELRVGLDRAPGERAWLSFTTALLPDLGGGASVVATFSEVTLLVEALQALEESRAHLRRITEAMPALLFELVREPIGHSTFTFANSHVEALLGVTLEELRSDALHALRYVPSLQAARIHVEFERALKANRPVTLEFEVVRPTGSTWVRLHASCERRGAQRRYTGVLLDVTRERELAEQLRLAQRAEAFGDLAAGIAHNFNNLLAAVVPNLELAEELVGDDVRPLLEDARRASQSGAELVRQLMGFARRETPSGAESVDLAGVLEELVAICRRLIDRRVTIECGQLTRGLRVRGRASLLQQVLLNLCLNARDALEGRPEPTISLSLEVRGDLAVVLVRDNGAGMDEATRARLGEPFFTTKPPGRGTGLGLATAYGTIRDLGGAIRCSSSKGLGTTFAIELPRLGEAHAAAPRREEPFQLPSLEGRRILVVDDEALVRAALGRVLRRAGAEVIECGSGADAIELLSTTTVELLLIDLSMPGLSGAETIARLRPTHPTLPICILSGFVAQPIEGADEVLEKPVQREQLAAFFNRHLAPRG